MPHYTTVSNTVPEYLYIRYIPNQITIRLYPEQVEEPLYQQIHDLQGISKICKADTVVEILVFLLQQPDHYYVIPAAQVVLNPFLRVIHAFIAMRMS